MGDRRGTSHVIFSIGDIMVDAYFRLPSLLTPRTDTVGRVDLVPGGSAANFAVWVARQGAPAAFIGRVGNDFLAEALRADLAAEGVRAYLARDEELGTGRVGVVVSEGGERDMICDRRANTRLCMADIPEDDLRELGTWLHVSGYALFEEEPREAARRAMDIALEAGIPVSVDPASYGFIRDIGVDRFLRLCRGAQVFLPNRDEAMALTDMSDPDDMLLALADVFPVVALKLGADGSAGLDRTGLGCYGGCSTGHSRGRFGSHSAGRSVGRSYGGSIVHASPVQVEAVDTNGAGDAFDAGFVVEYSSGGGLEAALMCGNAMGARVAAMHGAR